MGSRITSGEAQIANWVSIPLAITILLVRFICGRHYYKATFDLTTVVILASIVILIARIIVGYLVLRYDTAASILISGVTDFSDIDLDQVRTGTILSLISRLLITTLFWLQCILLLLFYTRILSHIHWVKIGIRLTWVVIGLSYIAVVLATFLECRPFHVYWQLTPDPGNCVKAYTQLYVQCSCNILIDLFLLCISWPVLDTQRSSSPHHSSWPRKLQIAGMYLLGAFCIIITCIRLAYIRTSNSAQPARSFWASVQAVVSTFVANAPSIYGQMKLKARKRTQSGSATKRRTALMDTYVLMDEMKPPSDSTRRGSRPAREGEDSDNISGEDVDVEDGVRSVTVAIEGFPRPAGKTEHVEKNGPWVQETEILPSPGLEQPGKGRGILDVLKK